MDSPLLLYVCVYFFSHIAYVKALINNNKWIIKDTLLILNLLNNSKQSIMSEQKENNSTPAKKHVSIEEPVKEEKPSKMKAGLFYIYIYYKYDLIFLI